MLPSLGAPGDYRTLFELSMLLCGAGMVASIAAALTALEAPPARLYAGVALAGLAPLALGPVLLTRYDLWPAALCALALAAFVAHRPRFGLAVLALAVAAKLYPLVLLPLALVYVARRAGVREAALALLVFVAALAAVVLPFALIAPDGLVHMLERQMGRPLQLESLGSAFLLAAHLVLGYVPTVVSTFGSQNLAGSLPDALALVHTVSQALAVLVVVILFVRGRGQKEELVTAAAAAVVAFVAFGKVLSPQFLIWLLPLVPLVAGPAGVLASALLVAALGLTQAWFPARYWDVVALSGTAWFVLARDLVLVALFAVLLRALVRPPRRARGAPRTA